MVQYRRDRMHGYRGGITLEDRVIKAIKFLSMSLDDKERSYQDFVPTKVWYSVRFIAHE